mgnify:CR=1 FL=1
MWNVGVHNLWSETQCPILSWTYGIEGAMDQWGMFVLSWWWVLNWFNGVYRQHSKTSELLCISSLLYIEYVIDLGLNINSVSVVELIGMYMFTFGICISRYGCTGHWPMLSTAQFWMGQGLLVYSYSKWCLMEFLSMVRDSLREALDCIDIALQYFWYWGPKVNAKVSLFNFLWANFLQQYLMGPLQCLGMHLQHVQYVFILLTTTILMLRDF